MTRTPPPVSIDIGPEPVWLTVQGLALGLTASALGVWAAALGEFSMPWRWTALASGVPLGLLATAVAWARGRDSRPLRLVFDGQVWSCGGPGQPSPSAPCMPVVALDLGRWMLLRLDPVAPTAGSARADRIAGVLCRRWVALSLGSASAHWHALRVALYCFEHGADRPPG